MKDLPALVPAGEWPPLIGRLLANRGVTDAAAARAFLALETPAAHPALPDIDRAVERLARACRAGELVAVFGDFDVDGVTSATLLTEGLTTLGAKPLPYLPHRENEGYGLNEEAVRSLHELGATLLVTADCGTSSIPEIAVATGLGMDVIVLDHHVVPDRLPAGATIVNPKRDPSVRDEPAACGIVYYVLLALFDALGRAPDEGRMIELVALGTVCDMAPLVDENRRLVREGLVALRRTERPGLRALMEVSGADPARCDTQTLGFSLGPRLNAAGRLAHARIAFDLLVATDEEQARELAQQLDALNKQRQQQTETACAIAEDLAAQQGDVPLLLIGHEEFPLGIVGLVAARLLEAHRRPAIVYNHGAEESRASARSIPEFHVTDALRSCKELFVRYGGHRAAAGFTALNENLPAIKERLLAYAARELAGKDLSPVLTIDAELPLASLRGEEIRWLARLAPFGIKNPEPVLLSRNVLVAERRAVGADGKHLRLKLRDGAVIWPAIAFRQEGAGIEEGARADVVYSLSADRRSDGLELRVLDVRRGTGIEEQGTRD
ncbi:MAG: single-stranded-DNA-specific exonuclease RecJ [Dehalococcoidia bacterium]